MRLADGFSCVRHQGRNTPLATDRAKPDHVLKVKKGGSMRSGVSRASRPISPYRRGLTFFVAELTELPITFVATTETL
jgi:hypothetical protein